MGLKIPGPQPVEIFGQGERWQVREIASPRRQVYAKLGRFGSVEHAKDVLNEVFGKIVEPWQLWGVVAGDGNKSLAVERLLTSYDVISLGNGKWAALDAEDRTHIIHAPTIPSGARIPPAACGIMVNAKCFINNRANVRPSCRECAVIWEREYKDK
jgi:hypothetical protein